MIKFKIIGGCFLWRMKKIVMTEGKRNIIASLLQEYDIKTAEDIHEV